MIDSQTQDGLHDPVMLLSVIGKVIGRRLSALLEPTGLKPRQMQTLMTLREAPLSQQALAERIGTHPAKLVALLNDLEASKLVKRCRDTDDRRRHTVSLSDLGHSRLDAVDVALEKLDRELFEGHATQDRTQLVALLEHIAANLGVSLCQAAADEACEDTAADRNGDRSRIA